MAAGRSSLKRRQTLGERLIPCDNVVGRPSFTLHPRVDEDHQIHCCCRQFCRDNIYLPAAHPFSLDYLPTIRFALFCRYCVCGWPAVITTAADISTILDVTLPPHPSPCETGG